MSKFFNKIDISSITPKPKPTKKKIGFNKEKLKTAIELIEEEVEKIRNGSSIYSAYAIDIKPKTPAYKTLQDIKKAPSIELLRLFTETAPSDFTSAPAKIMIKALYESLEEVKNDK